MCVHMQDHKMRTEDANHLRDAIDAADATDAMMQSCNDANGLLSGKELLSQETREEETPEFSFLGGGVRAGPRRRFETGESQDEDEASSSEEEREEEVESKVHLLAGSGADEALDIRCVGLAEQQRVPAGSGPWLSLRSIRGPPVA